MAAIKPDDEDLNQGLCVGNKFFGGTIETITQEHADAQTLS